MRPNHRWSLLITVSALMLLPTLTRGALVLQSDSPAYTLSPDGVTQTSVKVYLAQTESTTTLTTGGGINQFEISLGITSPASGTRPLLLLVETNTLFTGNKTGDSISATMGGSFSDFVSGVAAVDNRVFLGTFFFTGTASVPLTTYQITAPTSGEDTGYTFTADGSPLDGLIGAGSFTLAVPEPTSLALCGLICGWLLSRRRELHSVR